MQRTVGGLRLWIATTCWLGLVVPAVAPARERPIAGEVRSGGRPVPSARIFVAPAVAPMALSGSVSGRTDDQGRYQIDLGAAPWADGAVHAYVLAPGFRLGEAEIAPGQDRVDFDLTPQPWKDVSVRCVDPAGRPVGDVEVQVLLTGTVPWSTQTTDPDGRCRVAMASLMPIGLLARPGNARPVQVALGMGPGDPDTITLPVLPPVTGRVVDREGRPVPGVWVGLAILGDDKGGRRMMPLPGTRQPVQSDAEGRFTLAPQIHARDAAILSDPRRTSPLPVCFADAAFERVAHCWVDVFQPSDPLEIRLEPTRRVLMRIGLSSGVASPSARLGSTISLEPLPNRPDLRPPLIMRLLPASDPAESMPGMIDERLPAGTYQVAVRLTNPTIPGPSGTLASATRELVVPEGPGDFDGPTLELGMTEVTRLVGRPAPEIEAAELASGRLVTLGSLRGQVVVLDFWGYWCGACNRAMPHLTELQRKYAGRPLTIVSIHDQSAQDREAYDRKTGPARERLWSGRDLPFRVLLDRPNPDASGTGEGNGVTIHRYGVTSFPTTYVIDPSGTIVARVGPGEADRLDQLVEQLIRQAEAR